MTILAHIALPAAISGATLKAAQASPKCRYCAMGIVGFMGALPDLLGWLWALINDVSMWTYYQTFHAWWMWFLPPAGLHVLMDSWVHYPEGGMIVPIYYILEGICWAVSLPLLYYGAKDG